METRASSDPELLSQWCRHGQEAAFHQLVSRYANLVHHTAKRASFGNEVIAADASQLTFILLARKARSLTDRGSIAGWLHLTASLQAKNLLRKSQREIRKLEQLKTAMEPEPTSFQEDLWKEMQPVLDDALTALSETDKEALLLRFYRSLSIREIGETLGIVTDAAQKRVDRAMTRLRTKLVKRGIKITAPMGGTIVGGFTADAQASMPASSSMASKAIAVGAVGNSLSSSLPLLAIMKASSIAIPVLIILIAGFWSVNARHEIAELQVQRHRLENAILKHKNPASQTQIATNSNPGNHNLTSQRPSKINWNQVATQLSGTSSAQWGTFEKAEIDLQLSNYTQEDLAAALDEIESLSLTRFVKGQLINMVIFPMSKKHPEFTARKFAGKFEGSNSTASSYVAMAFGAWVKTDLTTATEWFDQEVTNGRFATKRLDGISSEQCAFEAGLTRVLLDTNPDEALRRFLSVPIGSRFSLLNEWSWNRPIESELPEFAKMIRAGIPADQQALAFAYKARGMEPDELYEYLDQIEATPDERAVCIEDVATSKLAGISSNRMVTLQDLTELRDWLEDDAPDDVTRITAKALAEAASDSDRYAYVGKVNFSAAAQLAIQVDLGNGNDDTLVAFLTNEISRSNKSDARRFASQIKDDSKRAEVLEALR
ncbi:sigma-70 family RNA polymerase sigma factor [Luteolibacter pohnpeiensis]|uniref:Sigma-70 family RNA polymerase sigma factor n=1 Tax=Luteolibacter pohnpeiensis TaxID=454153 RepID=A0A934S9X8_9BACT|nr:sigma-70 family RNA polymerase sigma factor [Luteolibacter pohnpeiensis]MBK1883964.1 sigma-70 family RNA polymerase sigma factor [Luteolibacter pohnpeiensis]